MESIAEVSCSADLVTLADHLPLGICLIDQHFALRLWNCTLEAWTGQPRADMESHSLLDLFPNLNQDSFRSVVENVFATGRSTDTCIDDQQHFIPAHSCVGDPSQLMLQRTTISRLDCSPQLALIVIEDVTARQLVDSQASQLEHAEFISGMSHELRKPLDTIFGYTDFLREQETAPERRAAFDGIRRNGERALTVISESLDFAKIESGQLRIDRAAFELKPLLHDIVSLIRLTAAEHGIEFTYTFDDNAPKSIESDPIRLRQILLNLLTNAVTFTDQGHVALSVSSGKLNDCNAVRFDVADTGVGIAVDRMKQLFDPFRQADAKLSPRKKGTGLGLAISERLSRLLGGRLSVVSQLEVGSTFTLTLPV